MSRSIADYITYKTHTLDNTIQYSASLNSFDLSW